MSTTGGGGLTVRSVLPSGLGCGGPRFEFRNEKHLEFNLTTPALDQPVPLWS